MNCSTSLLWLFVWCKCHYLGCSFFCLIQLAERTSKISWKLFKNSECICWVSILAVILVLTKLSPGDSGVKNLPARQETRVRFLGWKNPLEKEMATHSSILAWEFLGTEEPGGLQSIVSQNIWTRLKQLNSSSSSSPPLSSQGENIYSPPPRPQALPCPLPFHHLS